jgi:hypothetical protein
MPFVAGELVSHRTAGSARVRRSLSIGVSRARISYRGINAEAAPPAANNVHAFCFTQPEPRWAGARGPAFRLAQAGERR